MKTTLSLIAFALIVIAAHAQPASPITVEGQTDEQIVAIPSACGKQVSTDAVEIFVACIDLDALSQFFPGGASGKQTQVLVRAKTRDIDAVQIRLTSALGTTVNRDERWKELSTDMVGNWNALIAVNDRGEPKQLEVRLFARWKPPRADGISCCVATGAR